MAADAHEVAPSCVDESDLSRPRMEVATISISQTSDDRCLPGILFRDASMDERQLDRRNSSIFRQIAREFSSQWRSVLDNLIGVRMRRELEQKRTLGEPLSPGDLVVEGLHDWSMKEECPTGQELYDCLMSADCPPGSLRGFLKKLKLPDDYDGPLD